MEAMRAPTNVILTVVGNTHRRKGKCVVSQCSLDNNKRGYRSERNGKESNCKDYQRKGQTKGEGKGIERGLGGYPDVRLALLGLWALDGWK